MKKPGTKSKRRLKKKSYSGYAIFLSHVKAKDKYKVTSPPKVYKTKAQAMQELGKLIQKGWKKSELKILKY